MNQITEKAFAKLNLSLDVTGLRPDGYHEMRTVMQTVTLWDEVTVRLVPDGAVSSRSNLHYLPNGGRNIACQAAEAFFLRAGIQNLGAQITLKKRVPVCAGMGGGSSDAAAVLRALNRLTGTGFSAAELEELGRGLGSDVPFCISGGASLGLGRGDALTPLPRLPACSIVICKPPFSISTPELFRLIDDRSSRAHPDTEGLIAALRAQELSGVARRMFNVFEDVLPRRFSAIKALKSQLLDLGALGAVMSGTGSALFGIFDDAYLAVKARETLRGKGRECHLAHPTERLA